MYLSTFNLIAIIGDSHSSGQTIFHTHIHLIPRRGGDEENPRGGVRGVIKSKKNTNENPLSTIVINPKFELGL